MVPTAARAITKSKFVRSLRWKTWHPSCPKSRSSRRYDAEPSCPSRPQTNSRLFYFEWLGLAGAVAAIPAARSLAMRRISFTGTGLVSEKWTVPFRTS